MKPSNLSAILQDGHSFQYNCPYNGSQEVRISIHQIGELILTSGQLLAWDFFMGPDERYYFKKRIKPGSYSIILSVADFQLKMGTRIACAMVRISEKATVKWELAAINDPSTEGDGEIFSYGVDSGTGCFMDED